MYVYLKCCVAVLMVATALAQQPASKSQESVDTMELSRLETVGNYAYIRGDADALGHLWADDLIVIPVEIEGREYPSPDVLSP
ncbi:MAG TPA: hypothetical protein DCK99_00360 [Blastocatellia bacterium]|nr:hypothetical protein [Blastocatellia bacterium]